MRELSLFDSKGQTIIVAEISANHNQNFDLACQTILAAKNSGADAVKLQTYTADTLTIDCANQYFKINNQSPWDGQTLYDLYKKAYMPWEWQPKLKEYAHQIGLEFFSTPFDKTAVDFLEKMDVPFYKIASFEIFDLPFIRYVASRKKPVIISTGIANIADVDAAVKVCQEEGNNQIVLLKCTSSYPAPLNEANIRTITALQDRYHLPVGLSDHTTGQFAANAAVALGAKMIEKHFILDRKLGGADASFSMEPLEFKEMVDSIRNIEKALGKVSFEPSKAAQKNRVFARSLFIVRDAKKGEKITAQNIRSIRPGYGLHPKYFYEILGKKFTQDVLRGTPLSWDLIGE